MNKRALIAGIGNIFLGDDGFGCEVVKELARLKLPEDVKLYDYGVRGLDLAYALNEPYETVVLIDAIARGGRPGTVYVLQPDGLDGHGEASFDAHSMYPANVLAMARLLGTVTANILIVGCEPQDFGDEIDGRMGLSPAVADAVTKAAQAALKCVAVSQTLPERSVHSPLIHEKQGGL